MTQSQALLSLQETDLSLMRCKHSLEELPHRKRLEAVQAAQRKLAGDITKIVGQRKDIEIGISDHEKWAGEVRAQIEQATAEANEADFRSYQDLESRLTDCAKRLEKLEFESDKLMNELVRAERAERNARALADKLEAEKASLVADFKKQASDIQAEGQRLAAERADYVAQLDEDVLERYNKAVKRFDGLAVEKLEGNKPSMCRVTLSPSDFSVIRHLGIGAITECPYCHRILIVDGD